MIQKLKVTAGWLTIAHEVIAQLHDQHSTGPNQRYILLDNARIYWQDGQLAQVWYNRAAPHKDWAFIDLRAHFTPAMLAESDQLKQLPLASQKICINSILEALESTCLSCTSA